MNEYVVNIREFTWDNRPEDYVYIGRPSRWGNPFTHKNDHRTIYAVTLVATREEAVRKYEEYVRSNPDLMSRLGELRGKVLGCYCAPLPCHGDVLVKLLRETEGLP